MADQKKKESKKVRFLSGVQPSGKLHLGNYFGALRQHIALQEEGEAFYFIANYHAMTTVQDAKLLEQQTLGVALDYLALGLDPQKAVFFRQSDVPEVAELAWVLSAVTAKGLLDRATSYKDKVQRGISPSVGLYFYPMLMAADILIYRSHVVPVGEDQIQHVEMTRDMAQSFNRTYREVFPVPKHRLDAGAKVPGIDGQKMSKSYDNTIRMFWPGKKLKQAVMGIVTDSTPVEDPKDTSQALFQLWSLFADENDKREMFAKAQAGGLGYGDVKKDLLARILDHFGEMREKREALAQRPDEVEDILASGARRARELGAPVLAAARDAAGLGRG
jgi:tryptophanyl-tRNA synthetase